MNSDRELLELAAKAAGYEQLEWVEDQETWEDAGCEYFTGFLVGKDWRQWNPLTDDGDALRLAVKLHICTLFPMRGAVVKHVGAGQVGSPRPACMEPHDPEPYAATRRAIVRAAAEIGKQMQ